MSTNLKLGAVYITSGSILPCTYQLETNRVRKGHNNIFSFSLLISTFEVTAGKILSQISETFSVPPIFKDKHTI